MPEKSEIFISILLAFAVFFSAWTCTGLAGASPLLITEPSGEISLGAGESCELFLSVDNLPDGLSGYNLTVELDSPDVAEIQAVSFPEWATLTDVSELPASSVRLKAVDLQEAIGKGANDAELAVLTLKGLKGGSTGITVTVSRMDDDLENTIMLDGAEYSEEQTVEVGENASAGDGSKTSDSGGQSDNSSISVMQETENKKIGNKTTEEMKSSADENSSLGNDVEISSSETSKKPENSVNSGEEADESGNTKGIDAGKSTFQGSDSSIRYQSSLYLR
ncbi:hypothetical protein [Methanosarcina horonobensis]|uniref:hypothetical protein n=1 Tax=Methanosarcina horonobensis TaxID=418008 RepID=UPI000AF46FBC|nr:hypothetical protein [Methanosarcina horonobensis]